MASYEVIERSTGAAMSHPAPAPELMGTTLFKSLDEARRWLMEQDLGGSHDIRPARYTNG